MSSNQINAITVDQAEAGRLAVRSVAPAEARPGEISVRVTAISLNRGETRRALTTAETGTRPGWDFVGTVEDMHGVPGAPAVGTRVVGVLPSGAWAERVHAPLSFIAPIPGRRYVIDCARSRHANPARIPVVPSGRWYQAFDQQPRTAPASAHSGV